MSDRRDTNLPVAIIGSGPAGLMCASTIARAGRSVQIFEKKKGPGRKLLIAGSSGLNITYEHPLEQFHEFYTGPHEQLDQILKSFSPAQWLDFIHGLGIKTFLGTSRRYFVDGLKASKLLRAWIKDLETTNAKIEFNHECVDIESNDDLVTLTFSNGTTFDASAVCFALGGASYEETEKPLRWPKIFNNHSVRFNDFKPSNVGYEVDWPSEFLKETEGKPLKNVLLQTSRGKKQGELMITRYGIEGTPVYFYGTPGQASIDLLPDLTIDQIRARLTGSKEKLADRKSVV